MLTADWSWRGNELYLMNVMLQRGEGENGEREPEFLLTTEFNQRFTWIQTQTHTHTHEHTHTHTALLNSHHFSCDSGTNVHE